MRSIRVLLASLGAAALASSMLAGPAAPPARAGDLLTVTIAHDEFDPAVLNTQMGWTTRWDNTDAHPHTATSDQGFFNTGSIASGEDDHLTLRWAGTFPYHCNFHDMHGKIKIPMSSVTPIEGGFRVRWALEEAPAGRAFDVQWREAGDDGWKTFRKATVKPKGGFVRENGTYELRARTKNLNNDKNSGWSPILDLSID